MRKIGKIYNTPVVEGIENEITKNEILIQKDNEGKISLKKRINGNITEINIGTSKELEKISLYKSGKFFKIKDYNVLLTDGWDASPLRGFNSILFYFGYDSFKPVNVRDNKVLGIFDIKDDSMSNELRNSDFFKNNFEEVPESFFTQMNATSQIFVYPYTGEYRDGSLIYERLNFLYDTYGNKNIDINKHYTRFYLFGEDDFIITSLRKLDDGTFEGTGYLNSMPTDDYLSIKF